MSVAQPFNDFPVPFTPRHRSFCWRCGDPPGLHGSARGACTARHGCRCPAFLPEAPQEAVETHRPTRRVWLVRRPRRAVTAPSAGPRRRRPRRARSPQRRWGGVPHLVEVHDSRRFRAGSHGAAGYCSYFRHCQARALVDSFDAIGRRRALCRWHLHRSLVFGSKTS